MLLIGLEYDGDVRVYCVYQGLVFVDECENLSPKDFSLFNEQLEVCEVGLIGQRVLENSL